MRHLAYDWWSSASEKEMRLMGKKAIFIPLLIHVMGLMAAFPAIGQEASPAFPMLTLRLKAVPLTTVLDSVERQTGLRFSYESSLLEGLPLVSVNWRERPLAECLDVLFHELPIVWRAKSGYLILRHERKYATISGFVGDQSSRETLLSASVWDVGRRQGTVSNHYGYYSLRLPLGPVRIRASYVGFAPQTIALDLRRDTVLHFSLLPLDQLDEVLVTATTYRKEALTARPGVEELQPRRLNELPNLLGEADMLRSLQYLPGVAVGDDGLTTLAVRGGNTDENLYLFDGSPIYYPSHLLGLFSAFNPDALKAITFYKGAFPAEYGGRLSSVVDVRMRDGDRQAYHGGIGVGLLSARARLEGPIVKGRSSFNVAVRRSWMDFLLLKPIMALVNRDETNKKKVNYYFFDLNAKVNHSFSDRARVYFSFYMGQDALLFGEENKSAETHDLFRWRWGNLIANMGYNQVISPQVFMTLSGGYSRFRSRIWREEQSYEQPLGSMRQLYLQRRDTRSAIEDWHLRSAFDWSPSPRHRVRFGTEYLYHQFRPESGERVEQVETDQANLYSESTHVKGHEFSTYLEDEIHADEWLDLNLGLRYTLFQVDGRSYHSIQPRISTRFRLGKAYSVKLAYSKMNQYVHLISDSYINQPTDIWVPVTGNIPPMGSHQLQLAFSYDWNPTYTFSTELFYKAMTNVIEYRDNRAPTLAYRGWERRVGIGLGDAYGVEWIARKRLGKTTGWLSYTLGWSNRVFPDGSVNEGKPFPFRLDNRHKVNLVVTHRLSDRWSFTGAWTFASGNRVNLPEYVYLSPIALKNEGGLFAPVTNTVFPYFGENTFNRGLSGRNNYRLQPYHRLDLSATLTLPRGRWGQSAWSFGLYNAYGAPNPFLTEYEYRYSPSGESTIYLKKTSFLLFVPSVTYSFQF